MIFSYLTSLFKGVLLGGGVYYFGIFLDYTVSYNTFKIQKDKSPMLVEEADKYIRRNLLIISPLTYMYVDQWYLLHEPMFSCFHYIGLLLIQNIGYFFVHREMHRNRILYKHHNFHHNFDKDLYPSVGNAVSSIEFIIAYVFPFILGGFILKPTEITYLISIGTISILNLAIHTNELNGKKWIPGLISPSKHIIHHEKCTKNYAAPLIDIDKINEYVWIEHDNKNDYKSLQK